MSARLLRAADRGLRRRLAGPGASPVPGGRARGRGARRVRAAPGRVRSGMAASRGVQRSHAQCLAVRCAMLAVDVQWGVAIEGEEGGRWSCRRDGLGFQFHLLLDSALFPEPAWAYDDEK